MKTHTIKTPKAELLIVEPPISWGLVRGEESLLIYDHTKKVFGKTHTFNGDYTLLGSPDEISEEDARELVESQTFGKGHVSYMDYKSSKRNARLFGRTAKESLLSLLETEIFWKNPYDKSGMTFANEYENKWQEAEQKTFDRNRSLIFKKSK